MVRSVRSSRQFIISFIDQCIVSGANFATIALGAYYLSVAEQGKLIYIYTAYVALVLFNISAFFSAANVVRNEIKSDHAYYGILLKAQLKGGLLLAALVVSGFLVLQDALRWQLTANEGIFVFGFLFAQQISDYFRRAAYVFGNFATVALQAGWLYGLRIGLIAYSNPETVADFLLAMTVPGLPFIIVGVVKLFRGRKCLAPCSDSDKIIQLHVGLAKWNVYASPLRWIGLHMPIMLVGVLYSVEGAAILGTVRSITTFVNVFFELLETVVPSWLSNRQGHGNEALKSASLMLLYVGAVLWFSGAFAIWILGDWTVNYLLGKAYADYTAILYILWAGSGLYFMGRVATLHYRMQMNTQLEFYGLAIGMGGFILSIPLIGLYGPWGGAWCLTIVQFATLVGMFTYKYRHIS